MFKTIGVNPKYEVNEQGVVRNKTTLHELSLCLNTQGYYEVCLYNNGKDKYYRVHRLVAEAFIPNPDNLPCINHKDEDKTNNCVENLEWCTVAYNNAYGTRQERCDIMRGRPVVALKNGIVWKTFPSIVSAAKELNCNPSLIGHVLRGWDKTARGYEWRYLTEHTNKTMITGKKTKYYKRYTPKGYRGKPIELWNKEEFVRRFDSIAEASRETGIRKDTIREALSVSKKWRFA